ncbi:MAG: flavodoxin family protein [Desulforhopalus sp.]
MKKLVTSPPSISPEKRIIGFSGSPRKNGNSDILLKTILLGVTQERIPSTYFNLTDIQFQGCIGCEKCRKDKICTGLIDGMSLIYHELISSKGLVLVSPTHNYNVTSWMKAFIDRLYCFYNFENDRPRSWSSQFANQNRKAIVAAICEQENLDDMGFTLEAMRKPLEALGYEVTGQLSVFKIFDKAKVKYDEKAMKTAYQLGQKLALSLK